jgi:hypothetical protein
VCVCVCVFGDVMKYAVDDGAEAEGA